MSSNFELSDSLKKKSNLIVSLDVTQAKLFVLGEFLLCIFVRVISAAIIVIDAPLTTAALAVVLAVILLRLIV